MWSEIAKEQKKWHGPGKYDSTGFDEKRNRPPKGSYTVRRERITFVEEALWRGSESPGIYNPIEVVSEFIQRFTILVMLL